MSEIKTKPCAECKGTGRLVYSNTGVENWCMYCDGAGVVRVYPSSPGEGVTQCGYRQNY